MFVKRLMHLVYVSWILGTLMLSSPMQVNAQGLTLCGEVKQYDAENGWMRTGFFTAQEVMDFFPYPQSLNEGFYRLYNVVISPIDGPKYNGIPVTKQITSFSSYETINGFQDCAEAPTQPPPQIPTNTYIPPTPIPPTRIPTKAPTIATTLTLTLPALNPVPTPIRASPTPKKPATLIPTISIPTKPLSVYPDFKQNFGYWSNDTYDGTSWLIEDLGCAMTDMANLLSYYGAKDVDPGTLNDWMNKVDNNKNNGYANGAVKWWWTDHYPSSTVPVMKYDVLSGTDNPTVDLKNKIYEFLGNGWPVILQITGSQYGNDGHWVMAVGVRPTSAGQLEYVIMDPLAQVLGSENSFFTNYKPVAQLSVDAIITGDPHITAARFYVPSDSKQRPSLLAADAHIPTPKPYQPASGGSKASLIVVGHSPIAYVLIDEQGRRLGYDPTTSSHFWEIPDGDYVYIPPIWNPADPSASTKVGEGLEANLPNANAGDYCLIVYGVGDGPYEIETFYNDKQNQTNASSVDGTIQIGTTIIYDIQARQGSIQTQARQTSIMVASPDVVGVNNVSTVTLKLTDGAGMPMQNQQVFFETNLGTINQSAYTDNNGVATVEFRSGQETGVSRITAKIGDAGSYIDITINNQGVLMPSSGGGGGLVLLLILLVVGGVSIPLIRSRARKKISYSGIPAQAVLVGVDGSRNNIASTDFVIGRASNSSLCLKDSSVSRNHARIRYAQGQWFIQDLGSGGGTYVNGTRINAAKLQNGDRIRIGSSEFEFRA